MIIGGGIAGVTAAAHLAPRGSVVVLETEASLAYHTTGRSAAVFVVNYGTVGSRPLAVASRAFLEHPPPGSTDRELLADRGVLWIADETQEERLRTMASDATIPGSEAQMISGAAAVEMVPALRPDIVTAGMLEANARDIDVAGLHQAFVRIARGHGAVMHTNSPVRTVSRDGSGWKVTTDSDSFGTQIVVNASGAWGDAVAGLADVAPIGLEPRRRTAFMVPGSERFARWPLVVDTDHRFYFKPDGVQLLCSLGEEEPTEPGDPRPRMEDVALAIERINETTDLGIRSVNSQWVGLRTFAPDGNLVIGEDPIAPGFFWLVGQGGIGIATSPAAGSLLACLATGESISPELVAAGVDPTVLSPARFRP